MPLDPQAKMILDVLAASGAPSLETLPVDQARAAFAKMNFIPSTQPIAKIEDLTIPGPGGPIPIRVYNPFHEGNHPALVFYHGGGWVIGSIDTHDSLCRSLANLASCIVISVDYRLAPEHKFPAAAEDAYAAAKWVWENAASINVDSSRLAVGGDSAGGNLAAVVAIKAKEKGNPMLTYQMLLYPALGLSTDTVSHRENAEGYFLTRNLMVWFLQQYISNEEDLENPYASPLKAKDLNGLPPALVITAEFDPLRDEGSAYAQRLQDAGVKTEYICYEGMIHGFMSMDTFLTKGKQAIQQAAESLRIAFASQVGNL